jgi:membrane protein YdbS with pleckstrin-like domain
MQCPHCQTEVPADTVFCGHCGGKLDGEQAPVKPLVEPRRQGPPPLTEEESPRDRFTSAAKVRPEVAEPENEVWRGSYSQKAMLGYWIGATVVTILLPVLLWFFNLDMGWLWVWGAILIMWLALVAWYYSRRLGVFYRLTNQQFLHERGLLWRRTDRIELIDIDDVTYKQGPIERMLNVGTIHIESSDKSDPEIDLPGIDDVKRIAGLIDDLRREERRSRGLHIESV